MCGRPHDGRLQQRRNKHMKLADTFSLRARICLFFALIGAVAVSVFTAVLFWLYGTLDITAFSSVTSALFIALLALSAVIIWVALKFDENLAKPLVAIAADLKTIAHTDGKPVALSEKGAYLGLLGPAASDVALELEIARTRTEARITDALADAAKQKQTLEKLLQGLHNGLIVCSLTGRVSLYNQQAVDILHTEEFTIGDHSTAPVVIGTLGLGRDLFNIVDQSPFRTAIDTLISGSGNAPSMTIVFSTIDAAVTMRGHISLRRDDATHEPIGITLVFDDVTAELAAGLGRDRKLREVASTLLQATQAADQATMLCAVKQAQSLISEASSSIITSAWPTRDMAALTLFNGVRATTSSLNISLLCDGDDVLIHGDSATLISALRKITSGMVHHAGISDITISAQSDGSDRTIVIAGRNAKTFDTTWFEKVRTENADEQTAFLSIDSILERHYATAALEAANAILTVTLSFPKNTNAVAKPPRPQPNSARPEFYDFEIFSTGRLADIADVPLSKLYCVVFDCEMTGLDPRTADEIVSIAGVRVVNGRVLTGEKFDQLVNPGRTIPPSSTAIHHISDDMVLDAPKVGPALRAFHSFAHDQVLIAHNAAFDMAFLTKSEARANVKFDHIVLDTVLLAAHLQGATDALTLDALAERYQVNIPEEARHTALGDALATAHVFCQMIKQLENSGVVTLRDALDVSKAQTAIRRRQKAYT